MAIRNATLQDSKALETLWQVCGLTRPYNEPMRDIRSALAHPEATILVLEKDAQILGSVMVGHDGHRGNVYYVACHPDHQGRGLGGQLMGHAEEWLKARGVWKLNLMVRETNACVQGFYDRLGYEKQPRTVMTKWLEEPPGEMFD